MARTKKFRVNIYLPESLVNRLDSEAEELGISRGAVIAMNLSRYYQGIDTNSAVAKGIEFLSEDPERAMKLIGIH